MATLASLLVKLGLSASEFHEGLDKAEGRAASGSANIVSSLLKIGAGVAGFLAIKRGAETVAGELGSFATEAMAAQEVEAQLDQVLKSTGAAAAAQAEEYAAAKGKMVSSTALSSAALADLNQKLTDTQLKYNTLTASIQEQKQRVIDLTAQYGANGLATITAKNKLAEMQNTAQKLNGEMGSLSDQMAKGSVVTTQSLANKLGLLPPVAQMSKDELIDLADSLSTLTKFEDDTVIGAETMLLQFKTISRDVFPEATELALDLATRLKTDAAGGAQLLGKALVAPGEGLLRLKQAGVTFTDAQEKLIDKLMATNKIADAQRVIMDAVQASVGGAARAAGATAAGKWEIFKNQIGNVKEKLGTPLLGALAQVGQKLSESLASPTVQATIDKVAGGIGMVADKVGTVATLLLSGDFRGALAELVPQTVVDQVTAVVNGIGGFVTNQVIPFVTTHGPALKSALIAVLAVLGGFMILSTIGGLIATITNPIFLVIAAIGLLAAAWTEDWGGIRTWMTAFWESTLKPILTQVWTWLQTNIPVAIQTLANFWTGTLQPALATVWGFITGSVIPMLGQVWTWLATNIPAAIQTLSNFWNNTLMPALITAWAWIQTNLVPLFSKLGELIGAVLGRVMEATANQWNNVFLPVVRAVGGFIGEKLIPWIATLVSWIGEQLSPIIDRLKQRYLEPVIAVFNHWGEILAAIIGFIDNLIKKIKEIDLPDWLEPGSPAPIEIATRGWADALRELTSVRIPALQVGLQALPALAAVQPADSGQTGRSGGDTYQIYSGDPTSTAMWQRWIGAKHDQRLSAVMGG